MRSRINLAATYALLAVLATLANIASQDISLRIHDGSFSVPLSVAVGTAVGLVTKYLLDKRFIFYFRPDDLVHDGRTFLLYACMGVFTTLLFWSVEFLFHFLFATRELRYLGGVIGLAIGYAAKYQLDKRFVFQRGARND
jgi:hypothetical protein